MSCKPLRSHNTVAAMMISIGSRPRASRSGWRGRGTVRAVETALDHVAAGVEGLVERWWATAAGALRAAALDLIDLIEQRELLRVVPGLARGEDHRHRQSAPVDREMNLAGQPAAGSSEGFSVDDEGLVPPGAPVRSFHGIALITCR